MSGLKKFPVYTNVPVEDLERAKDFYRDILGLEELRSESGIPGAVMKAGNNTHIYLYLRGKTTADHTVMSFHVKRIESVVADLRDKGVVFETFENGEIKVVDGVATMKDEKAAWFKDSEGNILSLYERVAMKGEEVPT